MRLIDADTLIQEIMELRKDVKMSGWDDEYDRSFLSGENDGLIEAENLAKHAPTIDAVPVIRCKDCIHRDPDDKKCDSGHGIQWQLPRPDDWYCADAERKEK